MVEAGVWLKPNRPVPFLPILTSSCLRDQAPPSLRANLGPLNGWKQNPNQALALGKSRLLASVLAGHLPCPEIPVRVSGGAAAWGGDYL